MTTLSCLRCTAASWKTIAAKYSIGYLYNIQNVHGTIFVYISGIVCTAFITAYIIIPGPQSTASVHAPVAIATAGSLHINRYQTVYRAPQYFQITITIHIHHHGCCSKYKFII